MRRLWHVLLFLFCLLGLLAKQSNIAVVLSKIQIDGTIGGVV